MQRKACAHEILRLPAGSVPLRLRPSARARRLILRLEHDGEGVVVTHPPQVPPATARAFAERHADWIAARLAGLSRRVPFVPGAELPILGERHRIAHAPGARRGAWRAEGTLWVSGRAEHVARRVGDYLRGEARRELAGRATRLAARLAARLPAGHARPLGRIAVRDTASRWGSCSPRGNLSFSWRLVLAPEWVLDYVVAHEVAHLVHMNHAPAFWRLVGELSDQVAPARRWLRAQGRDLMRYG